MLKKPVRDIMASDVISLAPNASLTQAISLMRRKGISFVVIASGDNKPLGVITERDIINMASSKRMEDSPVAHIMSSPVHSISQDADVMTAMHTLVTNNIRHLIVVNDLGLISGVITLTNFLQRLGFEYFVEFKDVGEIMDRDPLILPADTSVFEAISSLSRKHASCLIALEDGRPAGIFTERDALKIAHEGKDLSCARLRDVMKGPLISAQDDTCVFEALSIMNKNRIRHLPVVGKDGTLTGLINQVDIARGMELKYTEFLKNIIEEKERSIREAHDFLETRVAERTAELISLNERLQREIEERKQADKARLESEERYRLAERAGNIGSWDWNILTEEVHWSDPIEPMFGFARGEFGGSYKDFLRTIHPEDRQFVIDSVNAALHEKKDYNIEHRIVWPDGTVRWVSETGAVYRDEGGKAVRMAGMVRDITDQRQADEALKKAFDEVEFKVRERTKELADANDRLKEMDRLKSIFIASMSHELRTPLNSIIGFTGVILQGMVGGLNDKQRDQLGRVYRNAKHLLALITDVIDISKLEGGKISPFIETFILKEVVEEAVDDLIDDIRSKGLEIEVNVSHELQMESDRRRMLECVVNLLSNAVKYTEKGEITITVNEGDRDVELSVSDTGIGIAKENIDRIFNPFERLESQLRMTTPGTGLGLYLCKNLATKILSGDVYVESRPGVGSKFTIRVPRTIG